MKNILYLIFITGFAIEVIAKPIQNKTQDHRSRMPRSIRIPKVCSTSDIDVRLETTDSSIHNQGIVGITFPRSPQPHHLCFPTDSTEQAKTLQLSHAICRQLGFVTLDDVQARKAPVPAYDAEDNSTTQRPPSPQNLKPSSWSCQGYEQSVSQCEWNHIEVEPCHQVTELTCGNCHKTFTDSEGLIRTPGYPLTMLYHLSCEWRIVAPETHTIYLVFDQFDTPPLEHSTFECASDKPYIELLYGNQGTFTFSRYCNFRQLKNLSIPFNSVRIRYFSGLYNPRALHVQEKRQGLAISFRAVPASAYSSLLWVFLVSFMAAIFLCLTSASCYYCRRKSPRYPTFRGTEFPRIETPNVPSKDDLDRAYSFQRCQIQGEKNLKPGLRLRSNGSRSKLSSVFQPVTSASERLASTFRKLSSQRTTPRTIIPEIVCPDHYVSEGKFLMISKCKTNLEDRFSSRCSDSSVFLPVEIEPNFHIYHSESNDSRQDISSSTVDVVPPPQERQI